MYLSREYDQNFIGVHILSSEEKECGDKLYRTQYEAEDGFIIFQQVTAIITISIYYSFLDVKMSSFV